MTDTTDVSVDMRNVISALALIVVVALLGLAPEVRGPWITRVALPEMAEAPVLLPGGAALYVQRYEVTVAEWTRCHAAGSCRLLVRIAADRDPLTTPATGLSHSDAREYIRWINTATGHDFRLPSKSEWEKMARSVLPKETDPMFSDPSLAWASGYLATGSASRRLRPQGSFSVTPEGIGDLDGSVWEWTQECYAGSIEKEDLARCPAFYVGGAHMAVIPYLVRDPARGGCAVGVPPAHLGVRLVTDSPLKTK